MATQYETRTLPVPLGGLNTRDEPTLMSRLQTPDMKNIQLEESLVKKRLGYITIGNNLPLSGTGMELIQYIDGQGVKHSIALTTTDAYLYDASNNEWDRITPNDGAATPTYSTFSGTDTDRWSVTISTNPSLFDQNGGSALIIDNSVDGPYYFEGQTGDYFRPLTVSTELTDFSAAQEIADFWNHLFLFNYNASAAGIQYTRNTAWHDVSGLATYANLGITENVLTDSAGQIRRAVKLGYDMTIYSDESITICRRVGGTSLFIFPTVIYRTGLFAANGLYDFNNQHFFLGSDRKLYNYQGGTQLIPIGDQVEDALFSAIDPSKKEYIVTGFDRNSKKIYWFYPTTSDDYAYEYLAFNYDNKTPTWEKGRFGTTVAGISTFSNKSSWACDDTVFVGVSVTDENYSTTACSDGTTIEGYPQTIFIDRDGYVYRLTGSASSDNGSAIEAYYTTPDLIPIEGRTHEYGRFSSFGFSAQSRISNSDVTVSYSTDEGLTWTTLDTVNLTDEWEEYNVKCDIKTRKIRFRLYQNAKGDFQIRHQTYTVTLNTYK